MTTGVLNGIDTTEILVNTQKKGTDLRRGGVGVEIKNVKRDGGVRVLRIRNGTEIEVTETDEVVMITTGEVNAPEVIEIRLSMKNRPAVTPNALPLNAGEVRLRAETKTLTQRLENDAKVGVIVARERGVIANTMASEQTNQNQLSLTSKMVQIMASTVIVMAIRTSPTRVGSVTTVTLHPLINSLLRTTVNRLMSHTIPKRSCIPLKLDQT